MSNILVEDTNAKPIGFLTSQQQDKRLLELRRTISEQFDLKNFHFRFLGADILSLQEEEIILGTVLSKCERAGFNSKIVIRLDADDSIDTSSILEASIEATLSPQQINNQDNPKKKLEKLPLGNSSSKMQGHHDTFYNEMVDLLNVDEYFEKWSGRACKGFIDVHWTAKKTTILLYEEKKLSVDQGSASYNALKAAAWRMKKAQSDFDEEYETMCLAIAEKGESVRRRYESELDTKLTILKRHQLALEMALNQSKGIEQEETADDEDDEDINIGVTQFSTEEEQKIANSILDERNDFALEI